MLVSTSAADVQHFFASAMLLPRWRVMALHFSIDSCFRWKHAHAVSDIMLQLYFPGLYAQT
jgi:hypothetical protein